MSRAPYLYYTFICLTTERNEVNLNQDCLKLPGIYCSVELATFLRAVSRGLLISGTFPLRPQRSFVSRRFGCRTREFSATTKFASTISACEKWNYQILVNLLVINVPMCVSRSTETLEYYQLQLPDVSADSVSSDTARTAQN